MMHRLLFGILALGMCVSYSCMFDTSVPFSAEDLPPKDASSIDALSLDASTEPPPDARPDASSGVRIFRNGVEGYAGTVDTYLSSETPDTAHGELEFVHWEMDSDEVGLLRFDSIFGSGPGLIPTGASIVRARLSLTISDPSETNESALQELSRDWDESATFDGFGATPGVQAEDLHDSMIAKIPLESGTHDINVTASLQRWADGDRENYGWALLSNDENDQRCRSSEYTATQYRTLLMVEYAW